MNSSQFSSRCRKRSLTFTVDTRPTTDITNTKTTENSKSYSRNFQQKFIDDDVYSNKYKYFDSRVSLKSNNLKEINEILIQSRFFLLPLQFFNKNFKEF